MKKNKSFCPKHHLSYNPSANLFANKKSIQTQLIVWSVVSLLILAILAGGYGFLNTYHKLNSIQNDNLKNTARLLLKLTFHEDGFSRRKNFHYYSRDDDGVYIDIVFLPITKPPQEVRPLPKNSLRHTADFAQNRQASPDHEQNGGQNNRQDVARPKPPSARSKRRSKKDGRLTMAMIQEISQGFSTFKIKGVMWRVFRLDRQNKIIIVRQQTDLQHKLAVANAMQSFLPLMMAILVLILLLPFLLGRMFLPIRHLASDIQSRIQRRSEDSPQAQTPMDLSLLKTDDLPSEIVPFVLAINRLLQQVQNHIDQQERFIADAAHELRSPLTAISLQVQRLQRLPNPPKVQEGLEKLALRVKRNQALVEQLLTLARLNHGVNLADSSKKVPLSQVLRESVGLLLPLADEKNIELNLQIDPSLLAHKTLDLQKNWVNETAFMLIVKNLLQNAILYTPKGGKIFLVLEQKFLGQAWLDDRAVCVLAGYLFSQELQAQNVQKDQGKNLQTKNLAKSWFCLRIVDTGVGVNEADYAKMFDPFVRLSGAEAGQEVANLAQVVRSDSAGGTVVGKVEGTGLGLSIVKTLCVQNAVSVYLAPSCQTQFNQTDYRGLQVILQF